jgi:hypothetical protein
VTYQPHRAEDATLKPVARYKHGCCADKACNDVTCMALPAGTTCGDCAHIKRCSAMFGHTPTDTYCDWLPRRFRTDGVPAGGEPTCWRCNGIGKEDGRDYCEACNPPAGVRDTQEKRDA